MTSSLLKFADDDYAWRLKPNAPSAALRTQLYGFTMAIVQDWLPPSRENWELVCTIWKYFPVVRLRRIPAYASILDLQQHLCR
jgi:hypothetical protein